MPKLREERPHGDLKLLVLVKTWVLCGFFGKYLDQRQAIELAFFGGKTHQEIAEALNEPLGTVKARIRRGMMKLRDSLQAYV